MHAPEKSQLEKYWDDPSFPKTDWKHLGVEELEVAGFTCEACGKEEIRFVHRLKHTLWEEIISVGCVCAGRLAGDTHDAKEREKEARNRAVRKAAFLRRKWNVESQRKLWLKMRRDGIDYTFILWRKNGRWSFFAWLDSCKARFQSPTSYKSIDEAKTALFNRFF
jgi:hypothetical protein